MLAELSSNRTLLILSFFATGPGGGGGGGGSAITEGGGVAVGADVGLLLVAILCVDSDQLNSDPFLICV